MVILNAVQGVLTIIIMLSVGYFLGWRGWFDDKSSKLFSKIVMNIAFPAYMISSIIGTYDKAKLVHLAKGLFIPFISIIVSYALSVGVSRIFKIAPGRKGIFCAVFSLSNTIFVGLPVNMALFGEESLPFALLYYIANTTVFWTIGVYAISRDGGRENHEKLFSMKNVKRIFSPPLTAFLLAIALILLEIKLPKSVLDTCKYLGNMTTPMSMIFIGLVVQSVSLRNFRPDKSTWVMLAGRFLISPLIVFGMSYYYPIPELMKRVFVIQAAMPALTSISIIAESYGADYKYAAVISTLTTIVSLASIPMYMLLLSGL